MNGKIQAKDLRSGNFVKSKDGPLRIPKLGIISEDWVEITAYGIHQIEQGFDGYEAVLLTKDWLLKLGFGFKGSHEYYDIYFHKETQYGIAHAKQDIPEAGIKQGDWVVDDWHTLNFVHELQNAFWYKTKGKELTFQ